jgi:ceramide glucosyltransferase
MSALAGVAVGVAGLFLAITAVRMALAVAVLRRPEPAAGPAAGRVTVVQAILAGDPTMPANLRENLANHPDAHFVWLIDYSDAEGRRVADELAGSTAATVDVVLTPPAPPGTNPKVFKLVRGAPLAGDLIAVLDDDTVLPPGALDRAVAALSQGDLVTGIPVYRVFGGVWSRLVAAFVNSNSILTYLPVLVFSQPVTINGMFVLTRHDVLDELGGFAAIVDRLCDDYELAKLYRRAGRRIVQTTIVHPLSTTVSGAADYARLLRRWLVFANQLLRESMTLPAFCLVVVPAVLPLVSVVLAVAGGSPVALATVLCVLLVKAVAVAALRRRTAATAAEGPATVVAEVVSDLLLPLHALTTAVRPRRVRWRGKDIRFGTGGSLT